MSEEGTQTDTEKATPEGAETGNDADTKDDEQDAVERALAKERQIEFDRRVSAGIKVYTDKQDKKLENELKVQKIQDGKYEELFKDSQAENDALKKSIESKEFKAEALAVLISLDAAHFADQIISSTKTIDEVLQAAEAFKKAVTEEASKEAVKLLDTGKPRVPTNEHTTKPTTLENMSADQWKAHKKATGLV